MSLRSKLKALEQAEAELATRTEERDEARRDSNTIRVAAARLAFASMKEQRDEAVMALQLSEDEPQGKWHRLLLLVKERDDSQHDFEIMTEARDSLGRAYQEAQGARETLCAERNGALRELVEACEEITLLKDKLEDANYELMEEF